MFLVPDIIKEVGGDEAWSFLLAKFEPKYYLKESPFWWRGGVRIGYTVNESEYSTIVYFQSSFIKLCFFCFVFNSAAIDGQFRYTNV